MSPSRLGMREHGEEEERHGPICLLGSHEDARRHKSASADFHVGAILQAGAFCGTAACSQTPQANNGAWKPLAPIILAWPLPLHDADINIQCVAQLCQGIRLCRHF
jgi:hypothetical protein